MLIHRFNSIDNNTFSVKINPLAYIIYSLNLAAMGESKADIVLKNCKLVNVYSREIIPHTHFAIVNDRIAYVGQDASHTIGEKTVVIDLEERYLTPGFADPHIHIDKYIRTSGFAKKHICSELT